MSFKRDEPFRGPPSTVQSDRQAFTLTFTPAAGLESQVNLTYMFLDLGVNRSTQRETIEAQGEHATSTERNRKTLADWWI